MIFEEDGEQVLSADVIFLYSHDSARLYTAINWTTAENLQFMFPEATMIFFWSIIMEVDYW